MREHHITPALASAVIEMSIPDKPNSRIQKYRLTQKGVAYVKMQAPKAMSCDLRMLETMVVEMSCFSVVVPQRTAQPFPARDFAGRT